MLEEGVGLVRSVAGLVERLNKGDLDRSNLLARLVSISSDALRLETELSQKQREVDSLKSQLDAIALLSDEDRDCYKLVRVSMYTNSNAYAYAKGGEKRGSGPWLCVQCFEVGRKSFLQPAGRGRSAKEVKRHSLALHKCNVCGSQLGD